MELSRIERVFEPDDEREYRLAQLLPLEAVDEDPPPMLEIRDELQRLLVGPRLRRMRGAEPVKQWFSREDVSTHALLELIGFALVHDHEMRYALLAEPSPIRRADLIKRHLAQLDMLVRFRGDAERAGKVYHDTRPLTAGDVAECAAFAITRPPHVNIDNMLVMPTDQATPQMVHRGGR